MPGGATGGQGWQVINQVRATEIGTDGRPVQGMRVDYQLDNGTVNHIFVPASQYTADQVKTMLQEHASNTAAVDALNSKS